MEALKKGKYSGNITGTFGTDGVLVCVTSYSPDHFNGAEHYHYNAHLSFTLEGGCVEKKKDSYEIPPGTITYYSAGEQHKVLKVARPTRRINLELEQSFLDEFHISDLMIRKGISRNPDAGFLMIKIYKEILMQDDFSPASIQGLLLQLIYRSERQTENKLPAWVQIVEAFLYDNRDEPVTLHQLSLLANVHPVTISKYFPKYFGSTLGEYIRKLRIESALALIKLPGYSLTEIAYACGFFDQSHFIRTFKKVTGFLPSSYQKS